MNMLNNFINFFIDNLPSLKATIFWGPIFIGWTYGYLRFIGYLKLSKKLKADYARKPFHILAFLTAFVLQTCYGLPMVILYGIMMSLVVAYAVIRGEKHPLYEAMARDKDAPFKTYYIVVPYLAALIGGFISNILFGPIAIVGYLVVGFGDAAGELVGVKWGKHKYIVPTFSKTKTTRSYEGSLGVLIVSILAIVIALIGFPQLNLSMQNILAIFLVGFASALSEGISPHGWDNATMQIVPAFLSMLLLK